MRTHTQVTLIALSVRPTAESPRWPRDPAAVGAFALGFTHQVLAMTAGGRAVGAPADDLVPNLR